MTVNVKRWDPISLGKLILVASTDIVFKSTEILMYAAGVNTAVKGHTILGCAV